MIDEDKYKVNYNDDRFTQVENDKLNAINEVSNDYNNMINSTDAQYNTLIKNSEETADKLAGIQQQQTDLALQKIENEKQKAQKQYEKEQRGAYVDYQKQLAGNNVMMASQGLGNSGYSESSQVAMYNTYQNRIATAKESLNNTITEYDLASKDAILQNSSALMKIYSEAAERQAQLTLESFQYKNTLMTDLTNKKLQLNSEYYSRWKDVQNQINTENQFAENIRQYNEQMAYKKERDAVADAQWQKEYNLAKSKSSGNPSGNANPIEIDANGITPDNYYFSNGYQPRYIDNTPVAESKLKVSDVFVGVSKEFGRQNIWEANGKYYVWDGKIKDYVDVTKQTNNSVKKKINYTWGE